ATIREVDRTLDPASDRCAKRKRLYGALERDLLTDEDSIRQQMGRVMASFIQTRIVRRWRSRRLAARQLGFGTLVSLAQGPRTSYPRSLSCGGSHRAGRRNDDAGVGRPSPPSAAVHRSRASALPRRRGSGQPKGSDPPPQSDARRAIHDKALGVATTTRRAVRGMTPTIKRVIDLEPSLGVGILTRRASEGSSHTLAGASG